MRVSVVIPCHNAESYIARAIGSALEQTHPPHEIMVVNDDSTDGSLAVARRFAAGGECRVVSERSGQAARTRNIGAPSQGGLRGARRFALHAVLASPTSIGAHGMLRRTVLPSGLRWMLRKGWQAMHGPSRI